MAVAISSYTSFLTIRNYLGAPLTRKSFVTTEGTLVGVWPVNIPAGETSAIVQIQANNGNTGSEGFVVYLTTIGQNTAKITFRFESNNNAERAWADTSNDNIIVTAERTSPGRPLTAIYTTSEATR